MRVLITTAKHRASFQLASLLTDDEILFGNHFLDFPIADSNSTAHQILTFCLDHDIKKVFPLSFLEIADLRKSLVLFDEFGIEVMLNTNETFIVNKASKTVSSFTELSTAFISLGYPTQKIAITHADGQGAMIEIDDSVTNNTQIWNNVETVSFTQLGKWFNQGAFSISLYQLGSNTQQFYVLAEYDKLMLPTQLEENHKNIIANTISGSSLKGFYHVTISEDSVLRMVNASC